MRAIRYLLDLGVWMTCTCGAAINRSADDD